MDVCLYCNVCLAFAPLSCESHFIKGLMKAWKHIHQRKVEDEKSKIHRDSADAYFLNVKHADVKSLLTDNQTSLHSEKVKKKCRVMERIVDVITVIRKCGLSYRGNKAEAAYSLENIAVNHVNVLKLILLLSKYDVCLQQHINSCVENSAKQRETGAKGRGSCWRILLACCQKTQSTELWMSSVNS